MMYDNLFMPAEWQPHKATWLAWPPGIYSFAERLAKLLPLVEDTYVTIINSLYLSEKIELLVCDKVMKAHVINLLKAQNIPLEAVRFHLVDYADIWMRDYGATFLAHRQSKKATAWVKWQYNAYGNKLAGLLKDNETIYAVKDVIDLPIIEAGFVMEGGAFDVNGAGALLAAKQCLLNPNRNPNLSQSQIEDKLKTYLGVQQIIWLNSGLVGDTTDGHIDNIARFVDENTILLACTDDKKSPNYKTSQENLSILKQVVNLHGKSFEIITLPLPEFYYEFKMSKELAPASYANFYIANDVVLVPQYGQETDAAALKIIKDCFKMRRVIDINCVELIYGGGSIHCITQQQPL
jgi:agmatine deiminase